MIHQKNPWRPRRRRGGAGPIRLVTAVAVLFCLVAMPVAAFQLSPMSAVIDVGGSTSTTTFEVRNGGGTPIAVELRATTRRIDPDGTEINADASDQIQIFPSQLVLRAGAAQTVRARWIGQGTPDRELPFRVVAEQLPINLNRQQEDASGVQFMLRYRATLYVRPRGVTPNIEVVRLERDDPDTLFLLVRNSGKRHQLFSRGTAILETVDGSRRELPLDEIEAFVGVNLLPGSTRRISLPRDQLPVDPTEIRFRFN